MADLPSDLVVAGVAPTADEAAADKVAGRWRGSLGVMVPAVMVAFIFGLCFIWPLIGPVPSPTGGTILDSNLPAFSSGHFLGTDDLKLDELITRRYTLDEINQGYEDMLSGRNIRGVLLHDH